MGATLKEWLEDPFDIEEQVQYPSHYTQGDIECIDAIRAALGREGFIAFCRGNAMKYLWRLMDKHDNGTVDAKKCRQYVDWIIKEFNDDAGDS